MKMIKRTLILLIIATTIFTVVKCNRIEDVDNIKQEQGEHTLPKEEKEDTNKKDEQNKEEKQEEDKKDNQGKEDENKDNEQDKEENQDDKEKEEIKSPVELG